MVIPVYKCAQCLNELCSRLQQTLVKITPKYEIILVDDRCPDNSYNEIARLAKIYPEIVDVRLSRNFGQHVAITAGLSVTKGSHAVVMDGDLQDPPEMIHVLLDKLRQGHDLVLARRSVRSHSWLRVSASKLYYSMLSYLIGTRVDGSYGSLSILNRKVINAFLRFREHDRHYILILLWLGFDRGVIEYGHEKRYTGKSAYSFTALLNHAINGILFQDTRFLRSIVVLGLIFAVLGFFLIPYFIYSYYAHGSFPGWTSLMVILLISTGLVLFCMGIIGLYVGKIFDEIKDRPLFVIDHKTGGALL